MFGRFFLENAQAKISAICGGLAICSLVLLLGNSLKLDSFVPGVIFDDLFFGQRWPHVAGYFLADVVLMGSVALLLPHRPVLATLIGLTWTGFVFVETLWDLPVFAYDPHMLLEELAFAVIYSVLLVLLAGHGYRRISEGIPIGKSGRARLTRFDVVRYAQPDHECGADRRLAPRR
jgi:hypothetical protein